MLNIGILDLQGSVSEHFQMLSKIENVKPYRIKNKEGLEKIDGLILPGGESTTIGKLLKIYNIFDSIKEKAITGLPIWGTCAGMILMAKNILDDDILHLQVMDISVRRNAYGSQLESFYTKGLIKQVSDTEIPLVFIRAPWIEEAFSGVHVLLEVDNKIIAVRQNNMLATSFHPELTDDLSFHKYFANLCLENKKLANSV